MVTKEHKHAAKVSLCFKVFWEIEIDRRQEEPMSTSRSLSTSDNLYKTTIPGSEFLP